MDRKMKFNNCATWLGNTAAENARLSYLASLTGDIVQLYGLYGVFGNVGLETALGNFIQKAISPPYNMKRVAAIMGDEAGFNLAFTYNNSVIATKRFTEINFENEFWFGMRVDFEPRNAVVGQTYGFTVTFNGNTYSASTVAVLGDTLATIAQRLLAQINGLIPGFLTQIRNGSQVQVINRGNLLGFTYTATANMRATLVNLAFQDWLNAASAAHAITQANGWVLSAYIANPLNSWGYAEMNEMVKHIDDFECTNYQTTPNERSTVFRNRQLFHLANACANRGITRQMHALHSAEPAFLGPYFRANTVVAPPTTASEQYWTDLWNGDTFPNKASINWQGFCYFVYSDFVTAPAIAK